MNSNGSKGLMKILSVLVAVFFIYLTANMTFSLLVRVLPGAELWQYGGIVGFDGAALLWFLLYMFGAEGAKQRTLCIWMFIGSVVLTCTAVIAEIILQQSFVNVPPKLGFIVVCIVILAIAGNLIALYVYHMNDPKLQENARKNSAQDTITDKALTYLEHGMDEIAAEVAAELGEEMRRKALYQLGVDPRRYLGKPTTRTIDHDPNEKPLNAPPQKRFNLHNFLNLGGNGTKEYAAETDNGNDSKNA